MFRVSKQPDEFHELMEHFQFDPIKWIPAWNLLESQCSMSNRFYHNMAHNVEVVSLVRFLRAECKSPEVVQLAAWFHDLFMNTSLQNNELLSAQYMQTFIKSQGSEYGPVSDEVYYLILATRRHDPHKTDKNACVLVDADLWRLADVARFDLHEKNIRKEYAQYSDEEFAIGRKAFYQKMLEREWIFSNLKMRGLYESMAIDLINGKLND